MDFLNITYLKTGNSRQKEAYSILTENRIFETLNEFNPLLVGTIPLEIDIESSDLDIICCFKTNEEFQQTLYSNFNKFSDFSLEEKIINATPSIIANFNIQGFPIEIFGQEIPTIQQMGYRHMITEYRLLQKHGEDFRKEIIKLKKEGFKTEPAFAEALGISGNPYTALLNIE